MKGNITQTTSGSRSKGKTDFDRLRRMRDAARVLGRSDAAERAAESILKTLSAKRTPALAGIHEVA